MICLLYTSVGEAIEEGNAEIFCPLHCETIDEVLASHQYYSSLVPESLVFWPTLLTLEELSPFFRCPILLEGEQIDFPKETKAKYMSGSLPLGRDLLNYPVTLDVDLLKKHAFVCGVPGAGKTNTMLGLCYNLWEKYRIPFLVLDPAKKEDVYKRQIKSSSALAFKAFAIRTKVSRLMLFAPVSM